MSPSTGLVVWLFFTLYWLIDGCAGSSLLLGSGCGAARPLFTAVHWILIGADSLAAGHQLRGMELQQFGFPVSCSAECGSFLHLALQPCPLHRQADP